MALDIRHEFTKRGHSSNQKKCSKAITNESIELKLVPSKMFIHNVLNYHKVNKRSLYIIFRKTLP